MDQAGWRCTKVREAFTAEVPVALAVEGAYPSRGGSAQVKLVRYGRDYSLLDEASPDANPGKVWSQSPSLLEKLIQGHVHLHTSVLVHKCLLSCREVSGHLLHGDLQYISIRVYWCPIRRSRSTKSVQDSILSAKEAAQLGRWVGRSLQSPARSSRLTTLRRLV